MPCACLCKACVINGRTGQVTLTYLLAYNLQGIQDGYQFSISVLPSFVDGLQRAETLDAC